MRSPDLPDVFIRPIKTVWSMSHYFEQTFILEDDGSWTWAGFHAGILSLVLSRKNIFWKAVITEISQTPMVNYLDFTYCCTSLGRVFLILFLGRTPNTQVSAQSQNKWQKEIHCRNFTNSDDHLAMVISSGLDLSALTLTLAVVPTVIWSISPMI